MAWCPRGWACSGLVSALLTLLSTDSCAWERGTCRTCLVSAGPESGGTLGSMRLERPPQARLTRVREPHPRNASPRRGCAAGGGAPWVALGGAGVRRCPWCRGQYPAPPLKRAALGHQHPSARRRAAGLSGGRPPRHGPVPPAPPSQPTRAGTASPRWQQCRWPGRMWRHRKEAAMGPPPRPLGGSPQAVA